MQIDDQFFEMRLIEIRGDILCTEIERKNQAGKTTYRKEKKVNIIASNT